MDTQHRAGALVIFAALATALWVAGPASAQKATRTRAAKPAVAAPRTAKPASSSDVAAVVGNDKITREQVANQILDSQIARLAVTDPNYADRQRVAAGSVGALVLKRMGASNGKPVTISRADVVQWLFTDKPQVLYTTVQNLIVERVVDQAAKKQGISLTPAESQAALAKSINQARTQFKMVGKSDAQVLANFGMRRDYLQEIVNTQTLLRKMALRDLEKKIGHPIGPNDFVKASHILVGVTPQASAAPGPDGQPAKATPEETEKAFAEGKTKIDAILADVKAGKKKFEEAAQENNENDRSKYQGGSLGVFMRGQMVPEFEKACFGLEPGKLSDPVRTQFGWHIIRLDALGKDIPTPERDQALDSMLQSAIQTKVSQLMAEARPQIKNYYEPPAQPTMPMMGGGQ